MLRRRGTRARRPAGRGHRPGRRRDLRTERLRPAETAPGPRDLFLDASAAVASGRYAEAVPLLDRVITAQPGHAAAHFCLAYCRQQAGEYQRALERYDAARVLLPTDPRPAYQRGLIYALLKKPALAEAEFSKAIATDARHADAYRYRGLARYRLGVAKAGERDGDKAAAVKFAAAESDLGDALDRGASALFVHFVRAAVRDARGDAAGAATDRAATTDAVLKTEADYLVRGWSRMKSDPKGAAADFQKAIELNPRSLVAYQNYTHVLADQLKDLDAALVVATKVADLYPEFAPSVAGRALVLARLGAAPRRTRRSSGRGSCPRTPRSPTWPRPCTRSRRERTPTTARRRLRCSAGRSARGTVT